MQIIGNLIEFFVNLKSRLFMRLTLNFNNFLLYILFIFLLQSCASLNLPESQSHKKCKNDSLYISQVKKITTNLEKHGFMQTSMVIASLAVEPLNSLAAGLRKIGRAHV